MATKNMMNLPNKHQRTPNQSNSKKGVNTNDLNQRNQAQAIPMPGLGAQADMTGSAMKQRSR